MEKKLYEPIIFMDDPIEIYMNNHITKFELSRLRKMHKMTQKDVSNATGLSVQCISDIESETSGNPTLKSIIRYLNCFGYELYFQKRST
jgi:DNA-binding XRE family transcriptional regulator